VIADDIEAQRAYLQEQTRASGFEIGLRVTSAGASFVLMEASTGDLRLISPPVPVSGSGEFRAALDAAIGAARR